LKNKPISKRGLIYFPVLFGIYPVAALLAINIGQIHFQVGLRAGLISLAGSLLLYLFLWRIIKNAGKAAVLSSYWILLFFSYGHIYTLVEGWKIGSLLVGRHTFLVVLWGGLFVSGCWLIIKKNSFSYNLLKLLNYISLILLLMPITQVGLSYIHLWNWQSQRGPIPPFNTTSSGDLPDIYWIILDGYSRADVLKEKYNLDTQPFISDLQKVGFVVPDCSQSNYAWTALSLSSTLYMNYLDTYIDLPKDNQHLDYLVYQRLISNSPVRQNLQSLGYKMIAFETGYPFTEITDADMYVVSNRNPLDKYQQGFEVNAFEVLFLRTTLLRILNEVNTKYLRNLDEKVMTPDLVHFNRVLFDFDQLKQIPKVPGHKFVFAHIVAPHPPFIFDENGSFSQIGAESIAYPAEVKYVNKRVLEVVQAILSQSKTPPIIVMQGDHGWDMPNRMSIFNAYHLPGDSNRKIYPTITPVNTFRMIFNQYFGGKFELLKDTSYFSPDEDKYNLSVVPPTCTVNIGN
jgi:hypothetical protein